jgi:hypothetical protein
MKRTQFACVLAVAAILIWSACRTPQAEENESADTTAVDSINGLSDADRAAGWQLLFNGQDLTGWTGFQSDSLSQKWVMEDGALHFNPDAAGSGGDLVTARDYDNFELSFEWKIDSCGNSGVIYLADVSDKYEAPWNTGPEYQVLDNACHPDANEGAGKRVAASNYDMNAPTADVVRPAGQWNQGVIKVDSAHVEHWLNGQKVVSYELGSEQWKQDLAASKWTDYPDYGTVRSGRITLQDHGNHVWYRNIKIREL